ncbi:hypothetical protein HMPREF0059_00878 [Actinomyces viscosus C505]|uniref:Uncharacterized protein n=2 Tax=Actinomyces TaxID=1654 RepID=F2UXS6_ACTVI|nr:hypothetical protein [Actinomyces viscosus]EGE38027.1 hypothetical protein HMPREF0059_00878 [Actinomyces viscosus C505]
MPDKQTDRDQRDSSTSLSSARDQQVAGGDEAATRTDSRLITSGKRHSPSEHQQSAPSHSRGIFKPSRIALVVILSALLGVVGYFAYNLMLMFNPGLEPHSFEERSAARAAAKHLRHDSRVSSVQVFEEESYNSGDAPTVSVHLKDGTSTDTATALLSSTRDKALGDDDGSTQIAITLKWSVEGTDINAFFLISASSHDIATNVQHDLSLVGEVKSIQRPGETLPLQIDYGDVTTPPSSLTTPSGSLTIKTFTMNGWKVTSTSNTDGQFSNPPFDQIITAARQASPTGTIDLDGDTLSVTGLVTDEKKGLTPEAAAPVVHAVADCQAAKLTTLQLNGKLQKGLSSDNDYWITFTCNNGTWASKYDSPSPSDTEILNKAAEL